MGWQRRQTAAHEVVMTDIIKTAAMQGHELLHQRLAGVPEQRWQHGCLAWSLGSASWRQRTTMSIASRHPKAWLPPLLLLLLLLLRARRAESEAPASATSVGLPARRSATCKGRECRKAGRQGRFQQKFIHA